MPNFQTPEAIEAALFTLPPDIQKAKRDELISLGMLPAPKEGAVTEGYQGLMGGLVQTARGFAGTAHEFNIPGGGAADLAARNLESRTHQYDPYEGYSTLASFTSLPALTRTVGQAIGSTVPGLAGAAVGGAAGTALGGPAGGAAGAYWGGLGTIFGQTFGTSIDEYRKKLPGLPEDEVFAATVISNLFQAAVEQGFGPQAVMQKGIEHLVEKAVAKATPDAARRMVKAGMWDAFKAAMVGAAAGAVKSGPDEAGEEFVQLAADHLTQALMGATGKDLPGAREYLENAIGGLVGGAFMGAPTGAFEGSAAHGLENRRAAYLKRKADREAATRALQQGPPPAAAVEPAASDVSEQQEAPPVESPAADAVQPEAPPAAPATPFEDPAPADQAEPVPPAAEAPPPTQADLDPTHPLGKASTDLDAQIIDAISETGKTFHDLPPEALAPAVEQAATPEVAAATPEVAPAAEPDLLPSYTLEEAMAGPGIQKLLDDGYRWEDEKNSFLAGPKKKPPLPVPAYKTAEEYRTALYALASKLNSFNALPSDPGYREASREHAREDELFEKLADAISLAKTKRKYIRKAAWYWKNARPMPTIYAISDGPYGAMDFEVPRDSDFDPDPAARRNKSKKRPEAFETRAEIESSLNEALVRLQKPSTSANVKARMEKIVQKRKAQLERGDYREAQYPDVTQKNPAPAAEAPAAPAPAAEAPAAEAAKPETKAVVDKPPPGGWTDADKVPKGKKQAAELDAPLGPKPIAEVAKKYGVEHYDAPLTREQWQDASKRMPWKRATWEHTAADGDVIASTGFEADGLFVFRGVDKSWGVVHKGVNYHLGRYDTLTDAKVAALRFSMAIPVDETDTGKLLERVGGKSQMAAIAPIQDDAYVKLSRRGVIVPKAEEAAPQPAPAAEATPDADLPPALSLESRRAKRIEYAAEMKRNGMESSGAPEYRRVERLLLKKDEPSTRDLVTIGRAIVDYQSRMKAAEDVIAEANKDGGKAPAATQPEAPAAPAAAAPEAPAPPRAVPSAAELLKPEVEPKRDAWISPAGMARVEGEIERLNRKALRLGMDPLSITVGESREVRLIESSERVGRFGDKTFYQTRRIGLDESIPSGWRDTGRTVTETHVTLNGEVPKVNGWHFAAVIDHLGEDGNVVRELPGETVPAAMREDGPTCDHCNTMRDRKQTFILKNDAGEAKRVGRTCLKDFLGTDNAETLAKRAELIGQLALILSDSEGEDDGEMGGGGSMKYVDLRRYLPYVALALRKDGWISRSKVRDGGADISTADIAMDRMFTDRDQRKNSLEQQDKDLANAAMEWAAEFRDRDGTSSLEHNMGVLATAGYANMDKHTGIAAWMVEGYRRSQGEQHRSADRKPSEYQGTVRERRNFGPLTVTKALALPGGDYGPQTMFLFEDPDGNVFKWITGAGDGDTFPVGKVMHVRAFVKSHEEYKGTKQTVLVRVTEIPADDSSKPRMVGESPKDNARQEIIPYDKKMVIVNTEAMPRGVGARYLEVVKGELGHYVAKQWRRKAEAAPADAVLIDMEPQKDAAAAPAPAQATAPATAPVEDEDTTPAPAKALPTIGVYAVPTERPFSPAPAPTPAPAPAALTVDDERYKMDEELSSAFGDLMAAVTRQRFAMTPEAGADQIDEILKAGAKVVRVLLKRGAYEFRGFVKFTMKHAGEQWHLIKPYVRGIWNTAVDALPEAERNKVPDVSRAEADAIFSAAESEAKQVYGKDGAANEEGPSDGSNGTPGDNGSVVVATPGVAAGQAGSAGGDTGPGRAGSATDVPGRSGGHGEESGAGPAGVGDGRAGSSGGSAESPDAGARSGQPGDADTAAVEPQPAADAAVPGGTGPGSERVGAQDYHIAPGVSLLPNGKKTRIAANVRAIKLLHRIEKAGRTATPEEQAVLAQYSGWGPYKPVFDDLRGKGMREYAEKGYSYLNDDSWTKNWGDSHTAVKEAMTEAEWKSAANSTANAHYTSRAIIEPMWAIARRLGFKGGKVGEFGAGIGHFAGLMPTDLAADTHMTMVERDSISARILSLLYPSAEVIGRSLEDTRIAPNSLHMIIGNFPFARLQVQDPDYPPLALHNYFFARALDALAPGGLLVVVTSASTMDAAASADARAMIGNRAWLLGAIRLPNTAFKGNAETEVVTDIMVLQKRAPGLTPRLEDWSQALPMPTKNLKEEDATVPVNEYYHAHPEMMLGTPSNEGKMYGDSEGKQTTFHPLPGELGEQVAGLVDKLPADALTPAVTVSDVQVQQKDEGKREFSFQVDKDGNVVQILGGQHVAPSWATEKTAAARAKSYIQFRDALLELIRMETRDGYSDEQIERARERLNALHDDHVKKFSTKAGPGFFNNANQHRKLSTDPDYWKVLYCEDVITTRVKGKNGKVKREKDFVKGAIFKSRQNFIWREPTHAADLDEAIAYSLVHRNGIDLSYLARLTAGPEADPRYAMDAELSDAFRDMMSKVEERLWTHENTWKDPRSGQWHPRDEYLSGNIVEKLEQAEKAAKDDARYSRNVAALRTAMPERVPFANISMEFGARWLPETLVRDFLRELTGVRELQADKSGTSQDWSVRGLNYWTKDANPLFSNYDVNVPYLDSEGKAVLDEEGKPATEKRASATQVVEHALRGKSVVIFDTYTDIEGREHRTKNVQATFAAATIRAKLNEDFQTWLAAEPERSTLTEGEYNRVVNAFVKPNLAEDTSDQAYPGATAFIAANGKPFVAKPHQRQAIRRGLMGSLLLAHGVGTGKTFVLTTLAMELKRLGLSRKTMVVVHNATLEQYASFVPKLYPNARVLIARDGDLAKDKRRQFLSRIALADWDIVVIAHSSFDLIPNNQERVQAYIDSELAKIDEAIEKQIAKEGKEAPSVRAMVARKEAMETMLKRLLNTAKDETVFWEDLGIDALFVDEAHLYKKLHFMTEKERVKGLDTGGSKKASSLYLKTLHIRERTGGRNVVLATGTPITNTLAEMYTMIRYVNPEVMQKYGIYHFDQFADLFAEQLPGMETDAGGRMRMIERFAYFKNQHELATMFQQVADVVLSADLKTLDRPELKGGAPTVVEIEPSAQVTGFTRYIKAYYEWYEALDGGGKRDESHIPIVLYGLARKSTIDMRLIDPTLPDDPDSKLSRAAENIMEKYREYDEDKGTQAVFMDLHRHITRTQIGWSQDKAGNPIPKYRETEDFNAWHELRRKLVALGIPEQEIACIDDVPMKQRQDIFDAVNRGAVRVIIGSTETMGTGVNMQERMACLHHVDAPFRPSDMEQRIGRAMRQGNMYEAIEEFRYGVRRSLDAGLYQILERKAKMIVDGMTGRGERRSAEMEEDAMNYAEASALLSGSTARMEHVGLSGKLAEMEAQAASHVGSQRTLEGKIRTAQSEKAMYAMYAADQEAAHKDYAGALSRPLLTFAMGDLRFSAVPKKDALLRISKAVKQSLEAAEAAVKEKVGDKARNRGVDYTYSGEINGIPLGFRVVAAEVTLKADDGTETKEIRSGMLTELKDERTHSVNLSTRATTGEGLVQGVQRAVDEIESLAKSSHQAVAENENVIRQVQPQIGKPFPHAGELEDMRARVAELEEILLREDARDGVTKSQKGDAKNAPRPKVSDFMPIDAKAVGAEFQVEDEEEIPGKSFDSKDVGDYEMADAETFYVNAGDSMANAVPVLVNGEVVEKMPFDMFTYRNGKRKSFEVVDGLTGFVVSRNHPTREVAVMTIAAYFSKPENEIEYREKRESWLQAIGASPRYRLTPEVQKRVDGIKAAAEAGRQFDVILAETKGRAPLALRLQKRYDRLNQELEDARARAREQGGEYDSDMPPSLDEVDRALGAEVKRLEEDNRQIQEKLLTYAASMKVDPEEERLRARRNQNDADIIKAVERQETGRSWRERLQRRIGIVDRARYNAVREGREFPAGMTPNKRGGMYRLEDGAMAALSRTSMDDARALWTRMFGSDEDLRDVSRLFTPDGLHALGRWTGAWAEIVNGQASPSDTAMHEAVHKAAEVFLEADDLARLEAAAGGKEALAEGIIQYARDGRGFAGLALRIVERLLRVLRRYFGSASAQDKVHEFYDQLLGGQFAGQNEQGLAGDPGLAYRKQARSNRTIAELVAAAESMSDWRDWYTRHQAVIARLFGEDAALFQDILSATSQMSDVKANVTYALRAYRQLKEGKPFTGFMRAVIRNLERIRDAESAQGPKIEAFTKANAGDEGAVAVDRHISRLLFNRQDPTTRQIRVARRYIANVAAELGWAPREVQAALWAFRQVETGSDPSEVLSYDTILENRADEIRAFREAFAGTEEPGGPGEGVSPRGPAGEEAQGEGEEARYRAAEPAPLALRGPLSGLHQDITSADTSLDENLPRVFSSPVFQPQGANLDIGAGRTQEPTELLKAKGVENVPFDPFNRSPDVNSRVLSRLQAGERFPTVTVANVLNVIREPESRANVIRQAARALKPDGTAYFQVYYARGKEEGATVKGYQMHRPTAFYVDEVKASFNDVQVRNDIIIARDPKRVTPAVWWLTDRADKGPRVLFRTAEQAAAAEEADRSAEGWLTDFLSMLRKKDVNARPEISKAARLLSTISHYSSKVPALRKMYEAALRMADDRHAYGEVIFGPGEVHIADLSRFIRENKQAWTQRVQPYLWEQDREARGPMVKDEMGQYVIYSSTGQRLGAAASEAEAWAAAHLSEEQELLADGWSAAEAAAVMKVRTINDNAWEMLSEDAREVEYLCKALGIPVPPVVMRDGTQINLRQALREMGDRRGYYMPRLRKAGQFVLQATKDGENPVRLHFDTIPGRALKGTRLKRKGYNVEYSLNNRPSEEAYLDVKSAAMEDLINNSLKRMGSDVDHATLDSLGLTSEWKTYSRKTDGQSESLLLVRGPYNERYNEAFKELEGYWSKEDEAWRFHAANKKTIKTLTRMILHIKHGELLPVESFAKALAENMATVLHSRGSQARKIGRNEATGKDVWVGYEEDALKAVAMAGRATAAGAAKRDMLRRMMQAFTGRDESWADFKARVKAEAPNITAEELWQAYDEQVKERRIESATQPEAYAEGISYMREMARNEEPSERVVGVLKGLASLKYLSGIAPAAVNMTALLTTVPAAMKGYGNISLTRTPVLLARGFERYRRHYMHLKFGIGPGLTGDDAVLFNEISRLGWDSQQMNREAITVLQNWGEQRIAWVTEKALLPFAVTERFNRASTVAAAFWGLCEKHEGQLTASDRAKYMQQAKEISDKAHGVYGKVNLPSWARGPSWAAQLARSWYMYKTFSHNFLAVMGELGLEKRDAAATLTLMLAPVVIAGLGAFPAKDLAKKILAALLDAVPGYEPPDDIEEAIYDAAESAFGPAGERTARAGLAGLAGFDLRGTLAIGVTDVPTNMTDLLGAPWSVMQDIGGGAADMAHGDLLKGAEKVLPRFASAPVKAWRESTQGVTTKSNQPVYYGNERLRSGMIDAGIRAAGFNPARLAVAREEMWNERQAEQKHDEARSGIYRRARAFYARNPYDRDPVEWAGILEQVNDYNARVRLSGSDAVPFITAESLKRLATTTGRAPKREQQRGQVPEQREAPALPESWTAYDVGSGGLMRGARTARVPRGPRQVAPAGSW